MKRENASNSWDDLVFENRNKEYGAYSVRKSYSQHMTTGLGLSVALACLLLILPKILAMIGGGESIIPDIPTLPDPITEILNPPKIQPPPQSVTPPQSNPSQARFTPTVVDTQPTDTIPTNVERDEMIVSVDGDGPPAVAGPGPGVIEAPPAPPSNVPLDFAEVMPEYDGGLQQMMKDVSKKIRYPHADQRIGTEGTVFVSFVVSDEGKVTDVKVVRGISSGCDKEAARVVALLKDWKPGQQNHRAVSVRMMLPIKFQLTK